MVDNKPHGRKNNSKNKAKPFKQETNSANMGAHLSLLVSATMLVATLVYYYRMVLLTELTTEATLFNTLYAEYGTVQMHDAIQYVCVAPRHFYLLLVGWCADRSLSWHWECVFNAWCSIGTNLCVCCRAVEEFSHTTELTYKQIVCKASDVHLWDRKLDHDWQRLFHWYLLLSFTNMQFVAPHPCGCTLCVY